MPKGVYKRTGKSAHNNYKEFCKRGHRRLVHGKGIICQECESLRRSTSLYRKQARERHMSESYRAYQWGKRGIKNTDLQNFTVQDYNRHFQIQGGMCKICGAHQSQLKSPLHVDHDHKTGIFRGLLCFKCNVALGNTNDNIEILDKMILYLSPKESSGQ